MRVSLASRWAEGVWFAWMMKQAGHDVRVTIDQSRYRDSFKGILETSPTLDSEGSDVVLFDQTGNGELADSVRQYVPTLGDSVLSDSLEHDRLFGINFMEKCGIRVPPYEHFTDPSSAIRFIKKTGKRYVFKPCGEGVDTSSTYVAKSPEDMLSFIDVLFRNAKVKEFILQEFVKGVEVSSEMWVNKTGWYALNATCETKKLMNGEIGPATGCSGNLVWMIKEDSLLFSRGLKRAYDALMSENYVGMIDLNAIVSNGELYGLEWTPRMGYEGTCNLTHLLNIDFAEFIARIARDERPAEIIPRHTFSATTRIGVPPYPVEDLPASAYKAGIPIGGLTPKLMTSFYALDIRANEMNEDLYETAGINGEIGAAIGCGETIGMAFDHVESVIKQLRIPNAMYRTDVKYNCARRYQELLEEGWL